jgi:hypothetical protein
MENNEYYLLPSDWHEVLTKEEIEMVKGKDEEAQRLGFDQGS